MSPPAPVGPQPLFGAALDGRLGDGWVERGHWSAESDANGVILMAAREEAELAHPIAGGAWEITGKLALIHLADLGGKRTERASVEIGLDDGGYVLLDLYELYEGALFLGTFARERDGQGVWKDEPTSKEFSQVAEGGDRTLVRFRLTARDGLLQVEVEGPRLDEDTQELADTVLSFKPLKLTGAATELRLRVLKGHASFRDVTLEVFSQ